MNPNKRWLPLMGRRAEGPAVEEPTGEAYRAEWIDFERGLRIGRLEPHERITQILKHHLEQSYGTRFITDRWGRGMFWQWICWLPTANRAAKPLSSDVNFGCAKLFVTVDVKRRVFKSGLQVERGYARGPAPYPGCLLRKDWDWHRLVSQCRKGSDLDGILGQLIHRDGFAAELGDWEANAVFTAANFRSADQLARIMARTPPREWVGFQLYYPLPETDVRSCTGPELMRAVKGVFDEVIPAMNACMQIALTPRPKPPFG